jgi:hypothetical protein
VQILDMRHAWCLITLVYVQDAELSMLHENWYLCRSCYGLANSVL